MTDNLIIQGIEITQKDWDEAERLLRLYEFYQKTQYNQKNNSKKKQTVKT